MSIGRREFLKGASVMAVSGISGGCFADRLMPKAPDLRFGAISDVHLRTPGDEKELIKAFTYFKSMRADAVMISGDIADTGLISELRRLGEAWEKVFPGNKGADGRHVEKLFIYGNHDFWGTYNLIKNKDPRAQKDAISYTETRPAEVWEEIFKEPYSDFWIKDVKGYTFIGGHWTKSDQFSGLADFLKLHKDRIDPKKPFFYAQHRIPFGLTEYRNKKDGICDKGGAAPALAKFRNAIALCGHGHRSCMDDRSFYCKDGRVCVEIPATKFPLLAPPGPNTKGVEDKAHPYQCLVMNVYDSVVEFERIDFKSGRELAPRWKV
jgi:3',5'-cyclic AMP phosphodiesterase CpdA